MQKRHDFSLGTRRILAERAGQRCSNPQCGRATSGASDAQAAKSTVLGKAAHITAAAPRGARYNKSLTADERKSVNNGIWLCAECADRVDKSENVDAYPVELLNWWKKLQEEMSGTDLASVENRRRYPLRRLTVEHVAGVQGTATINFAAVTLVKGTSKLNRSVGELLQLFCDRDSFSRARQPISGDSYEHSRLALPDGRHLVVNVKTPWRHFPAEGRLRLLSSDGREFECVVTQRGAQFSMGGTPLPSFSPVARTISVIEPYSRYIYPNPWSSAPDVRAIEERIAAYFNVSLQELLACIRGTPRDTSIFGYDYFVDDEARCHVKCGRYAAQLHISSLSSGETSRVILDLAVRIAAYAANVSPVILLVHQWAVPSDSTGIRLFLQWLDTQKPPFQTVMDVADPRSMDALLGTLCYEAVGTDMDVSAFHLVPVLHFPRTETSDQVTQRSSGPRSPLAGR